MWAMHMRKGRSAREKRVGAVACTGARGVRLRRLASLNEHRRQETRSGEGEARSSTPKEGLTLDTMMPCGGPALDADSFM